MAGMRRVGIAALAGWMALGSAHAASVDPVAARATAIRDRFVTAIRKCGAVPSFIPGIDVNTDANLVSYRFDDRAVHLGRWADLPPPLKGMMTAWAAQGTMGLKPDEMFGEVFNDFLVAHELGHYLEHMAGRIDTKDPTVSETNANRIAIAFWSIDRADRTRLPTRYANVTQFLFAQPDPVPLGQDPRTYLAKNYARMSQDGSAYGWYQGRFLRDAWAQRGKPDFCGWVKANPPLPQQQVKR